MRSLDLLFFDERPKPKPPTRGVPAVAVAFLVAAAELLAPGLRALALGLPISPPIPLFGRPVPVGFGLAAEDLRVPFV